MSLAKQEANPGFAKNLRMFSRTPAQKQGIKPIGGAMTYTPEQLEAAAEVYATRMRQYPTAEAGA